MSSFQKTKEIEILTDRSKVMNSGIELMHFVQFSRYLNRFNFGFDP